MCINGLVIFSHLIYLFSSFQNLFISVSLKCVDYDVLLIHTDIGTSYGRYKTYQ